MKIIKAKKSGFCYGVKRAIDIVESTLRNSKNKNVYCLGPIIHNPQVVSELQGKGLKVIENFKGLKDCEVILPSHGLRPSIVEELKTYSVKIVDATCPYVLASQKITQNLGNEGYQVIIFGDENHPEIKGLLGIAKNSIVVNNCGELKKLNSKNSKIGLVAQTTKSLSDYAKIIDYLLRIDFKEIRIFNTICNDTQIRQDCVRELAGKVDLMFIIGGKNSANTRHLAEIAFDKKIFVHHIESVADLKWSWLADKETIGIASGASTPEYIIDEVINKLKK